MCSCFARLQRGAIQNTRVKEVCLAQRFGGDWDEAHSDLLLLLARVIIPRHVLQMLVRWQASVDGGHSRCESIQKQLLARALFVLLDEVQDDDRGSVACKKILGGRK
jgi:hypothetical protein